MKKLFSINDNKFITHTSQKPEDKSCEYWEDKEYTIDCNRRINDVLCNFTLHRAVDLNEISKICKNIGAEHYSCLHTGDYVLDSEKGNLFYEENEYGKVIFFSTEHYRFISSYKYEYSNPTVYKPCDFGSFVYNKQSDGELDLNIRTRHNLRKTLFTFKK